MSKMRIYTVHINPERKNPYENPVFVEESFNWAAFIFRPFWALAHKLWLAAAVLFVLMIGGEVLVAQGILPVHIYSILNLGIMLYVGFQANDWRRAKLRSQGYIVCDIVTGSDLVGAEQRFFDRYYPQHSRLPHGSPKSSAPFPA